MVQNSPAKRMPTTYKHVFKNHTSSNRIWQAPNVLVLTLKWDYKNITVDLSIPDYVRSSLRKLQHTPPAETQDAPHRWNEPTHINKIQYADPMMITLLYSPEKYAST